MVIFARLNFGLLPHKYTSCNKLELKPTLAILQETAFSWWSNIQFSPYLKYRKVFSPCPDFIILSILSSAFLYPFFYIPFHHPHFIIRIFPSAFYHPPSAAIRSSVYRDDYATYHIVHNSSFISWHLVHTTWNTKSTGKPLHELHCSGTVGLFFPDWATLTLRLLARSRRIYCGILQIFLWLTGKLG